MKTSDFDYQLPPDLIAQTPLEPRDESRLMTINRNNGTIEHNKFKQLAKFLRPDDVLVMNDSRVIPARLFGKKVPSGGKVEILLLRRLETCSWEALLRPGSRVRPGTRIIIDNDHANNCKMDLFAEIIEARQHGIKVVTFSDDNLLHTLGEIPLPPYIHHPLERPERYQTVYSNCEGSVAAPTAGLHLTSELLEQIQQKGIECLFLTLHVGLDTFRPVTEDNPQEHVIHQEYGIISPAVAASLCAAKKAGRRIVCVGTTSVRMLEHAASKSESDFIDPFSGWVDLFILPGYRFRATSVMVTNFHLPKSTLLMMVSAFAGKELIEKCYREAIAGNYRFYSFGDAMLIQ